MKNDESGNFDDMLNKGAWLVADMFKGFMNELVIPVIEGKSKNEAVHIRKPRPGEIIAMDYDDEKCARYGIYAGGGEVIAIFSETGSAGIIKKAGIEEFLDGRNHYYVIDMDEFKDDIGIDAELSEGIDAKGITLEFVCDEKSLAAANSLAGCETLDSSADAMLAMALWCRTGLTDKDDVIYVKSLIGNYKTYVDHETSNKQANNEDKAGETE